MRTSKQRDFQICIIAPSILGLQIYHKQDRALIQVFQVFQSSFLEHYEQYCIHFCYMLTNFRFSTNDISIKH